MKKFLFLFYFCLLTSSFLLKAQAPQGIPYQAIARNASGVAIANTAVKVRFSIRDSIAAGAIKYQETHNPTTSALGLFSVNVGMGTVVSGSFSGINWGKNAKFLQVELDLAGGNNYTDLGTTQMMSVPYAIYAGVAGSSIQTNPSYTPSADSVLTLVGVIKLPEGSYSVPMNETWKIVSITVPKEINSTEFRIYNTGCNTISSTSATCLYEANSYLYSVKIDQARYSEMISPGYSQSATNCSECPPYIVKPWPGYISNGYSSLQMPLWANGGELISIGRLFLVYVEKYR
jgi:hypothetical protein